MYRKSIYWRDGVAIVGLSSLLLSLGALSYFNRSNHPSVNASKEHRLKIAASIEIMVKGAVLYPGVYTMREGDSMSSLLEKVQPLPEADLNHLKIDAKLKKDRTVTIPKLKKVIVYLEGAVTRPGPIELREGTRVQDLITLGVCQETANVSALNKKRRLKDREVIHVPFKTQLAPRAQVGFK